MSLAASTFRKFAQILDGQLSPDQHTIFIDYGRIKISYVTGKISQLTVHLAHTFVLPKVSLKIENSFDRFGKRIRINKEVQTGDALFDHHIYIQNSVSEKVTLKLLSNERLRKSALFILRSGFDRIKFENTQIILIRSGSTFDSIPPETMRDIVAAAEIIVLSIPEESQLQFTPARWTPGDKLLLGLAMIPILPMVVTVFKEDDWKTVDSIEGFAFKLAFASCLISVPIFARIVRGYHNSLKLLCAACVVSLFMYWLSLSSLTMAANAIFDSSVSVTHVTKILGQRVLQGKYRDYYFVTIVSWQKNSTSIDIEVNQAFLRSKAIGSTMKVTTKSGAFGWERILNYR